MKLHSPAFERRLKRGIRAAKQSSPALRTNHGQKYRKQYSLRPLGRPFVTAMLGLVVWLVVAVTGHPLTGLAVITAWTFVWIFLRTSQIQTNLYRAADLPALVVLPISEPDISRWQVWKVCRASLMSLADLLIGLVVLALYVGFSSAASLAVIPIAIVAWAVMIVCSMLLAARCPDLPYSLVPSGLLVLGVVFWISNRWLVPLIVGFIDRHALAVNVLLPPGWASSQFLLLTEPRDWRVLWLLLPASLLLLSARDSLTRLRGNYRLIETINPEVPDIVLEEAPPAPAPAFRQMPRRVEISDIENIILSRRFLAPSPSARRDWCEQRLHHWCDAREEVLADFIFPNGFPIVARWTKIVRNLAVVAFVALLLMNLAPAVGTWTLGLGVAFVSLHALGQFLDTGTAFREMSFGGARIHAYVAYGVGFRELSRFLLKCSFVQFPLLLICLTGCSLLGARLMEWSIVTSLLVGLKGSALVAAFRFVVLTLTFSSGTNDTSGFRRALPLLASILPLAGVFLLLAGGSWYVPNLGAWGLWLLAVLDAYLFFRVYGVFYNGKHFDLMTVPKT